MKSIIFENGSHLILFYYKSLKIARKKLLLKSKNIFKRNYFSKKRLAVGTLQVIHVFYFLNPCIETLMMKKVATRRGLGNNIIDQEVTCAYQTLFLLYVFFA